MSVESPDETNWEHQYLYKLERMVSTLSEQIDKLEEARDQWNSLLVFHKESILRREKITLNRG
jgi:hypothetical protein